MTTAIIGVVVMVGFLFLVLRDIDRDHNRRVRARNERFRYTPTWQSTTTHRPAWEPAGRTDWERVADIWSTPGTNPTYHRARQEQLRRDWPALADALDRASRNRNPR